MAATTSRSSAPAGAPAPATRLPRGIYAIGATSLLNDAASEMIYPLLPAFLTSVLGAGAATLGVIEGSADALSSLLKLVSGHLSDRGDRRKPLVVLGYVIAGLARPLVAFARGAGFVLAVRLVDRTGKGLRASPRDALIGDLAPPGLHGRAYGVHEAMDHAGAVIGPLVAYGLLALGLPLRRVFLLSAIPALAACLVVALVVREAPRRRAARAAVAEAPGPVLSRPFIGYLAAVVLFALGNSSDAFLLLRAQDAGVPVAAAPLLWSLHHVVKSAISPSGGALADRVGRRPALALGWLVYSAIYAGFAFATGAAAIATLFVVYGLHFALVGGAQKALVAEIVPPAARARGFGAYHLCVGLAALPASLIFGLLYQRLGAPAAFLTGSGLALGAVLVLPLSRRGNVTAGERSVSGP
jgi:MFS family permease